MPMRELMGKDYVEQVDEMNIVYREQPRQVYIEPVVKAKGIIDDF